jgi:hypothetical protein
MSRKHPALHLHRPQRHSQILQLSTPLPLHRLPDLLLLHIQHPPPRTLLFPEKQQPHHLPLRMHTYARKLMREVLRDGGCIHGGFVRIAGDEGVFFKWLEDLFGEARAVRDASDVDGLLGEAAGIR